MTQNSLKQRLGIIRPRFSDYLKSKGRRSLSKKRFSKASLRKSIDQDEQVQSTLLNYSTKTSEIELSDISQPMWMNDYRKCCMLLAEVDGILEEVREEKARKLLAVNQDKHRRVIQRLYGEASGKLGQVERVLKGIEKGIDVGSAPQQKKIFANTLMSLAMRTRQKAKDIRQAQQQDLMQHNQLKKYSSLNLDGQNLMNKDVQQQGNWLSQQGFQALQQQLSNQRNDQILKIVASIHSLNSICKQLQDVVIQQGGLLDRIDENINVAAFNVKEANQHLAQAEEYQRSPTANRVIFVLVLLIVLCTLVLAFR